ncbi:MAG TPA: cyclophilin-like fold protein [Caulobacter sp.]|nr:cyclophilin-like fold protein [Caulobacter sp.]
MRRTVLAAASLALVSMGHAMAQDRIQIISSWGNVTATLADNAAARAFARRLPVKIEMRDHLRQEKTGALSAPLPQAERQVTFEPGTLGLWGSADFVIYYGEGRVPQSGIVVLGKVTGDASVFDRPGPILVQVRRADGHALAK